MVQKHQAGAFEDEVETANLLQQYEADRGPGTPRRQAGAGRLPLFCRAEEATSECKKRLAALSSREAEYNRLSQDLTLAVTAAQSYAERTTEERINTSLANARVSGLRIAQLAPPPDFPAFPNRSFFLALGLVGRSFCHRLRLLPEALACVGTYEAVSRGSTEAATDVRQGAETARRLTSDCRTKIAPLRGWAPRWPAA